MKKNRAPTFILLGLMIIVVVIHPVDNRYLVQDNLLRQIDPDISILIDTTPSVEQLRKTKDSLERIKSWKKWRLIAPAEGFTSNYIGLRDISECDSCNQIMNSSKNPELFHRKYFLDIPGFTLKPDASFLIEKEKYFIKYYVEDRAYDNWSVGHEEVRQIPVRFSSGFDGKQPTTSLLIPLSKTSRNILNILIWIFFIVVIIVSIWAFIRFVSTLLAIANGRAFTLQNIRNLKFIAWFIIATIFIPMLFAASCQLLMQHRIPKEIYFPYWLYLDDNKGWLIASLIAFLLADAFKNGYKLQQEQDLTI